MPAKGHVGRYQQLTVHEIRVAKYIFEKLNSLSFPWDFQGILNFSLSNSREENSTKCIFVGDHVPYSWFSLSFPGFFYKN